MKSTFANIFQLEFIKNIYCAFSYMLVLAIGLIIFDDFGVSWDERYHLEYGMVLFNHIFKGAFLITSGDQIFYGPFFDLCAHILLQALRLEDIRSIFLAKHLMTFLLFWLSLFFFYKFCRKYFGSWVPAYIGCFFLVIHPRILAESFYNPKDLPFLSMFIIGCFTLQWYMEQKTFYRAAIHGIVCAICIDVRVLGVMIPCLTAFLIFLEVLEIRPNLRKIASLFLSLSTYIAFVISFTLLFWPFLWDDPVEKFCNIIKLMTSYPYRWSILYQGNFFNASTLPWHYIPIWVLITTPVSIIVLFILGNLSIVGTLRRFASTEIEFSIKTFFPYLWFWSPLIILIFFRGTVYNGWRHMYFIYPAFVIIAARGCMILWNLLRSLSRPLFRKLFLGALIVLMSFDFISLLLFMVRAHPNEYIYFNKLVGGLSGAKGRFEWDYFGLAHRQLLEGILRKNNGIKNIPIVGTEPTLNNILILNPDQRRRLRLVTIVPVSQRYLDPGGLKQNETVYYCSNLRGGIFGEFSLYPSISAVRVEDSTIAIAIKIVP